MGTIAEELHQYLFLLVAAKHSITKMTKVNQKLRYTIIVVMSAIDCWQPRDRISLSTAQVVLAKTRTT